MTRRNVSRQVLLLLHEESLAEHGGGSGLRDEGLFDSALMRPQNLATCGTPDLAGLAAAYGVGLAKNHAFVDGNKRVAAAAMIMFVYLNEHELECDEDELVELTVGVAAGTTTKAEVAVFLAAHILG